MLRGVLCTHVGPIYHLAGLAHLGRWTCSFPLGAFLLPVRQMDGNVASELQGRLVNPLLLCLCHVGHGTDWIILVLAKLAFILYLIFVNSSSPTTS